MTKINSDKVTFVLNLSFRYYKLNHLKRSISLLLFLMWMPFTSQASDSITAYIFLLDECVICQSYTNTLNELYAEYGEEVSFIGVFPNFSSKPAKIEQWKTMHKIKFPTRTDYFKDLSRKLGAEIMPQIVLFNETTEEILYNGRIDDKFARIGKQRRVITTHEFADALEAIRNESSISIKVTQPIGCFINFEDQLSKK